MEYGFFNHMCSLARKHGWKTQYAMFQHILSDRSQTQYSCTCAIEQTKQKQCIFYYSILNEKNERRFLVVSL